jgi:hypothetical protein
MMHQWLFWRGIALNFNFSFFMKAWKLGYETAKEKAKTLYITIGHIPSPALGGELVAFTSIGFNHLVRKGRNPRTRNEQKKRFVLVQHIESMVQNPRAVIEYRQTVEKIEANRHGEKVLIESIAEFWTSLSRSMTYR